jgi:hypothetical protein
MLQLDFHDNKGPMATLILITVLNISLVISFLTANIAGAGFYPNGIGLYAFVALELAGVIVAYLICKRRNATMQL